MEKSIYSHYLQAFWAIISIFGLKQTFINFLYDKLLPTFQLSVIQSQRSKRFTRFRPGGVRRVSKMAEELIFFLIPIDSCPTKQNPLSNQFFRLWKLEKSEVEHVNKEWKKYLSAIIITYIKRAFCCSTQSMQRMVDQHLSTFPVTLWFKTMENHL